MENESIFALDIGTRKIIGLIMKKTPLGYEVLASEMIEHRTRAMLDGQIHDVEAVASTILEIKTILEERMHTRLESAAVAAAGRALRTARGKAEKSRNFVSEISSEEVRALEIEAVQEAQYILAREELGKRDGANYFCVGYSVIIYQLENQPIGNLIGQVGNTASVEVIATFLPRVVVDSLFSSLKRAELDIYSMTLEPIAALSVAIPPNMRLLNLALVDIGAGTSDIAIVKNGNIAAYAMVPLGGDELTEHLAATYLLDFNSAEEVKCKLSTNEQLQFADILGNELNVPAEEIQQALDPIVQDLASEIVSNIISLNQKAPDAVLLVGGGSLTPGLAAHIASIMQIPRNRVGIRTPESFKHINGDLKNLDGPQGVTPLGIAFNSIDKSPVPFIKVAVNGREAALWNMGEIDVASALLSSGISLNNVYGKPGLGKTIEINSYLKVFKGEMGTAPVIKVNGKEASLDTPVRNGDEIEFTKGEDGQDAQITLENINPGSNGYVYINGERIELRPVITINGEAWNPQDPIPDRAKVEIERLEYLDKILLQAGLPENLLQEKTYNYYLNDQAMFLKWSAVKALVDGVAVPINSTVGFGSYIEYQIGKERPRIKDVLNLPHDTADCNVMVNGEKIVLKGKGYILKRNGLNISAEEELFNGARLSFDKGQSDAILSDIFQAIDIKPHSNRRLIMRVDGEEAGYTTAISNHSKIELEWE